MYQVKSSCLTSLTSWDVVKIAPYGISLTKSVPSTDFTVLVGGTWLLKAASAVLAVSFYSITCIERGGQKGRARWCSRSTEKPEAIKCSTGHI